MVSNAQIGSATIPSAAWVKARSSWWRGGGERKDPSLKTCTGCAVDAPPLMKSLTGPGCPIVFQYLNHVLSRRMPA
jgi:hypothetical protein